MPRDRWATASYRQAKEAWRPIVAAGGVACSRCGQILDPLAPWDLDHYDDTDPEALHPAHPICNRAAGGAKGGRRGRLADGLAWGSAR